MQQGANQQQEQVLELEPPLVLAGGGDQIAHRGKDDRGRLAAGEQVEQDRDRRGQQASQRPGVKKADHPERVAGASERLPEHDAVRRVGGDAVVADPVTAAGEPPLAHHLADGLRYAPAQSRGRSTDRRPRLGILEPRLRRSTEVELARVHDVENEHLVSSVAEKPQRLERQGTVEQQIGDEDDQPPAPELVHHPAERRLGRRALARIQRRQGLHQLAPVAEPGPRRNDGADVVVEGHEPDGVALAEENQRRAATRRWA